MSEGEIELVEPRLSPVRSLLMHGLELRMFPEGMMLKC